MQKYIIEGVIKRTLLKQCYIGYQPIFNKKLIGVSQIVKHYSFTFSGMLDCLSYWNSDGGEYWSYELVEANTIHISTIPLNSAIFENPQKIEYYTKAVS